MGIIPFARMEEMLGFWAVVRLLPLLGEVGGVRSLVKTNALSSWFLQVYVVEPAPSQDPEALRDAHVPTTLALPSILAARVAVTFSAISFLLHWGTLASPSTAHTGVWLWQPADKCDWGWLALMPLWEPPENGLVLGDSALLASL